ncbi:MAG: hypothetical protein A2V83_00335 [Nitrospirae bacterium RBG_16_64_22]|nr:MAG: hypothetical protein A2V83_00335 [Nitrospirae bacterium RBG_16_64_22]
MTEQKAHAEPKTPAEFYKLGQTLYRGGYHGQALAVFEKGLDLAPGDPRFISYIGVLTALVRRDVKKAIELCRKAIDEQPYVGQWYVNLATVYEKSRQKEEAALVLRRGLVAENGHRELLSMLKKLQPRRKPFIGSLDRDHPINKLLGMVSHRLIKKKAS